MDPTAFRSGRGARSPGAGTGPIPHPERPAHRPWPAACGRARPPHGLRKPCVARECRGTSPHARSHWHPVRDAGRSRTVPGIARLSLHGSIRGWPADGPRPPYARTSAGHDRHGRRARRTWRGPLVPAARLGSGGCTGFGPSSKVRLTSPSARSAVRTDRREAVVGTRVHVPTTPRSEIPRGGAIIPSAPCPSRCDTRPHLQVRRRASCTWCSRTPRQYRNWQAQSLVVQKLNQCVGDASRSPH